MFPFVAELANGELRVHVHRHDLSTRQGTLGSWTFVTDGLENHGHRELVLSIVREPAEEPASFPEVLPFCAQVLEFAKRGRVAQPGSFTDFGPTGSFGLSRLGAIAWLPRQALAGIEIPSSALTGVFLTREERELARMAGLQRVLARLGRDTRQFPFPTWFDRKRSSVAVEREFERSFLAHFRVAGGPGMHSWMSGKTVTLSLSTTAAAFAREQLAQLPASAPFALVTELPPGARAAFVWQPGQNRAEAIRGDAPGTGSDGPLTLGEGELDISGSFIAFVPEQVQNSGRLVEDGFAFTLNDDVWADVRDAIGSGKALVVPPTDGGFALELRPRDPSTVSSAGAPTGGRPFRARVMMKAPPPDQFESHVDKSAFEAFLNALAAVIPGAAATCVGPTAGAGVIVRVALSAPRTIDLSVDPGQLGATDEFRKEVERRVREIQPPQVRAPVIFEFEAEVLPPAAGASQEL